MSYIKTPSGSPVPLIHKRKIKRPDKPAHFSCLCAGVAHNCMASKTKSRTFPNDVNHNNRRRSTIGGKGIHKTLKKNLNTRNTANELNATTPVHLCLLFFFFGINPPRRCQMKIEALQIQKSNSRTNTRTPQVANCLKHPATPTPTSY